ncbi:MAG: efflux RND transporter periplasmic adaptor subunit [Verrucomicrobia bacterium]|jgi:RND family efflux transporter MFP subunit|nr:efflux RND transporter periplasmic adaptor subunit [Verrucomicrobiota bacterium]
MKHFWILLALMALASCKKGGGPPRDAPVPVELVAVEVGPLLEKLQASGVLDAEESVDLKPEVDGEVTSIQMTEGETVKKGGLILQIDESKQQAIVAEAESDFRLAQETLHRADVLLADGTISKQEHDQSHAGYRRSEAALNLARKRLTEFTLTAPFDGILGRRYISVGQYVSPQTILVSIYALDRMKLDFSVPERYSARVKPGQTLSLTVAAHGEEKFSGEIYLVEPEVDSETRTVQVRAYVPNADHRLKPGMFANVSLSVGTKESALTLPEDCIFPHTGGFAVYRDAGGVAELVPVQTGLRIPGRVEILSGLKAGDLVARSGNLRLSPGRKLLPQPASP